MTKENWTQESMTKEDWKELPATMCLSAVQLIRHYPAIQHVRIDHIDNAVRVTVVYQDGTNAEKVSCTKALPTDAGD